MKHKALVIIVLSIMLFSTKLIAAPGTLAQAPLVTSSEKVPNNLMILLDNSGSMGHRVTGTNETRRVVQERAVNELLDNLEDMRVGLAYFSKILVGIDDLDAPVNDKRFPNLKTHRDVLKAANEYANNRYHTSWWTYTTLAYHMLIRYFRGDTNDRLTMHPGTSRETVKNALTIFNRSAEFENTSDFPSVQNTHSPIQGYCQKNFVLIVTDGENTHLDYRIDDETGLNDYLSGYDREMSPNERYRDNDVSEERTPKATKLDDIANAAYDMDLLPKMTAPDGTPVKTNIITYTVGFDVDTEFLRETAKHAGGKYISAIGEKTLSEALAEIKEHIVASNKQYSLAGVAVNAPSLETDTHVFSVNYNIGNWTGDVLARQMNKQAQLIQAPLWRAQTSTARLLPSERFMWTFNRDAKRPVLFEDVSSLSRDQRNDLSQAPDGRRDDLAQERVAYLRGDKTQEESKFRVRDSLLGDIVHSSPVFVGKPEGAFPNHMAGTSAEERFKAFIQRNAQRKGVVYVGNNNPGSLQAYDAKTGKLLMDYIPHALFSSEAKQGLHYLTDKDYAHRYYMDGPIVVHDAYTKLTANGSPDWHTILVGGLGAGGKGIYGLNITNQSQLTPNHLNDIFMWEFTSDDHRDMGYSYGKPVIGLLNNGRYAAIVPNGFNNEGSGSAVIYVLFLDGGLNGRWRKGRDYLVFDTGMGSNRGRSDNTNGASVVEAVDLTGDGAIDRVYMGDILGNIWALDLSSVHARDWRFAYGSKSRPQPLLSTGRPITGGLRIVKNTHNLAEPNLSILFGTGQFLTEEDKIDQSTQYFINVWDVGKGALTLRDLLQQPYKINTVGMRQLDTEGIDVDLGSNGINRIQYQGCFITLPAPGERVVNQSYIYNDLVFFNTMIPQQVNVKQNICTAPSTSGGWLMGLDINTCGDPRYALLEVADEQGRDEQNSLGKSTVSGVKLSGLPNQLIYRSGYLLIPTEQGHIEAIKLLAHPSMVGRLSWQDLTATQTSHLMEQDASKVTQ